MSSLPIIIPRAGLNLSKLSLYVPLLVRIKTDGASDYVHTVVRFPEPRVNQTKPPSSLSFIQLLRLHSTELVSGPVHSRARLRRIDLIRQLTPLRVVNTVNPALSFNDNATMLVDVFSTIDTLGLVALDLGLLDGDGAVLAIARVDLKSLLVGSDVQADSGGAGVHVDDGDDGVTSCVLRRPVYDEAVVVPDAVGSAESVGFLDVLAD